MKMASKSQDEMRASMNLALDKALNNLAAIWEEIGIISDQRTARFEVVMQHVCGILTAMVEEEEGLKDKLMKNIEKFGEEALQLCKEMKRPPHEPPNGITILQLERDLRKTVDKLKLDKHERLKRLKKMREQDQHLCDVLSHAPYYIASNDVPSEEQLKELNQHIIELEAEKERRLQIFVTTRDKIKRLLEDLERNADTSFERDILAEEDDSFLLSKPRMQELKNLHESLEAEQKENFALAAQLRDQLGSLWERLRLPDDERHQFSAAHTGFRPKVIQSLKDEISRCEILKLENMQSVIEETRKQLEVWWGKCYFSEEQRSKFTAIKATEFTENLLDKHEREVEKVKQYYRENQPMLEKVARRQDLWAEFLEFERKANDPNRLFNRGCNLLKEEKNRKKLMKELPRVEQDVTEEIAVWEKENCRPFLVGGVRFVEFIKKQWEEWKLAKESEKCQRNKKKAAEMEEEMIYGSKPVTPGKRRFMGTPAKTPTSKVRKCQDATTPMYLMNDTGAKTPMSVSRMQRSAFNSVYSPHVPRSTGPKTPHRPHTHTAPRKPFAEKTTNETTNLFSQTHVAGTKPPVTEPNVTTASDSSSASLASIGPYHEFAKGLNHNARQTNCRSSVLPGKAPPAFF